MLVGEIAAAFTAGFLSAANAIRIAYYRGKVIASASGKGKMLAVGLGAEEVLPDIARFQEKVVVACHNSPNSVTLSGDAGSLDQIHRDFEARKLFVREVRTNGKAYHSPHMALVASAYKDVLDSTMSSKSDRTRQEGQCRMISTVFNDFVDHKALGPSYWAANLTNPVLFNQAVNRITSEITDVDLFVEIGPHPALAGPLRQIFAHIDKPISYISTLKRDHNDVDQMLHLAGELWTRNSDIDMRSVTSVEGLCPDGTVEHTSGSLLVDLPTYQWNYSKKYLSEPRQSREHRQCRHPRHDLLGRRLPGLSLADPQWRNVLRLEDVPWLKDHVVSLFKFSDLVHRLI